MRKSLEKGDKYLLKKKIFESQIIPPSLHSLDTKRLFEYAPHDLKRIPSDLESALPSNPNEKGPRRSVSKTAPRHLVSPDSRQGHPNRLKDANQVPF